MEKIKRKLFFWTLAALFLITMPVVVLHARGYRFDISRAVFVYSGTIIFKSNPQNVDVKLNDEVTSSKKINRINNSYNLTGLLPSDYDIQISAPGFRSWSKKTDVHSGVASEFWNVVLVRDNYEKTDNNTPGIDKFFTSPRNRYIAYTVSSETHLDVNIFNIKDEITESAFNFSDWNFIEEARQENIEWSPDENYISIPMKRDKQKTKKTNEIVGNSKQDIESGVEYNYFIIDLDTKESLNLNQILEKDNIKNVRWDPKEKGFLFFLIENELFRVDIKNPQSQTSIAKDVSSFDISRDGIYFSKLPNNLIFKSDLLGKTEATQITSAYLGNENDLIVKTILYDDDRIAMISQEGNLFIYNVGEVSIYFRKLGEKIKGVHFSDDGKKMIFWSDYEISVYYLRDWQVQPVRIENDSQSITRYSEPIRNVQWFKDYEHIIFTSGRWTKITELDPRDHINCMDLISTEMENPFVIYNGFLEKLYFTDYQGDSKSLFNIVFPEPVSFLNLVGIG